MHKGLNKGQTLSLIVVFLFMVSLSYGSPVVSEPTRTSYDSITRLDYNPVQAVPSQTSDNGTYVWWEQSSDSYSDEWEWENRNWLFGPRPSFEIYHEDGSPFTDESYAEIGEQIKINASIPKDVFTQGSQLGEIYFYGYYLTPDWNFSANFDFGWRAEDSYQPWWAYSSTYNQSMVEGPYTPEDPFLNIVSTQCSNSSDPHNYYVNFVIEFNANTPLGLYEMNMQVMDTQWNSIGSYNFEYNREFNGIAVGMDPADAFTWTYDGRYTLQKLDLDGDDLYSVSRGNDFLMRFNISGQTPEYVQLGFRVPGHIDNLVTVTGWHSEAVTEYGGWVFDELLDTYIWDPGVSVTTMKEVFGEYQRLEFTETGTMVEIEQRWLNWNETHGYWVESYDTWTEKEFMFIWNSTTDAFETYFGYTYYTYPFETYVPNVWEEQVTVYEPVDSSLLFYELDAGLSSATTIDGQLVVDFAGHFTELMPVTNEHSYLHFEDRVIGSDNYWYSPDAYYGEGARQTQSEYEIAKRIAIETPVTLASLLLEDGSEPGGWIFSAEKGENFMVRGRLQGGASIAEDIDAVALELNAWDGQWEEDEERWSDLRYEIIYRLDGSVILEAFNRTEKRNYTYGFYEDYVYTNFTGYYNFYNDSTSTWEWKYGEYWEWAWAEVEGWHWQWWYFNQLSQEWQTDHLDWQSAETSVPADFAVVSGLNNWTDDGDLYVTFLVNMAEHVPDTEYWWDFKFMNDTWYIDYSSPYGEHETLSWGQEMVYSFDYMSEKVYVEPIVENQLAFYSPILTGMEGSLFLMGDERPYIVVNDEKIPIKVRENYDPYSNTVWKDFFFYDHYDPLTRQDVYYYELDNGTKIYVQYETTGYIYNVTSADGLDSFLTGQEYAYYWNDGVTWYYYWVDIDGIIHQGTWMNYGTPYVSKYFVDNVEVDEFDYNYFVRYGTSSTLDLRSHWRWDSMTNRYFMTGTDGLQYWLTYDDYTGYYYATIDGTVERVSWPMEYYNAEFLGSDARLVTYDLKRYWFTEVDGVDYEMPYSGANAQYHHQLANTVSDGGLVPTIKSVRFMDSYYAVYNISTTYFADIMGTSYNITEPMYMSYTVANGTEVWNPTVVGYSAQVGTIDDDLQFNAKETIIFDDSYPYNIGDERYFASLYSGDPLAANNTAYLVNDTYIFLLFEYNDGMSTFYSGQQYPYWYESDGLEFYYYEDVNGIWHNQTSYEPLTKLATHRVIAYYNWSFGGYWFDFMGTHQFNHNAMYTSGYLLFNATSSEELFIDRYGSGFNPVYGFDYKGTPVQAVAERENINRVRTQWGYALEYGPSSIESVVYKNFHSLYVGIPDWGMWGVQNWVTNPDNGALDLDGDLTTEDDQYFVQEEYESKNSWSESWDRLYVHINWDPNQTLAGDEMNINSWMGVQTTTYSNEWNQTFFWYDPVTMESLDSTEMDTVRDTVLSTEGDPKPGYWDISWMVTNTTWDDIVAEAEAEGWDWIQEEQSWTWLTFGISQNYGTSIYDGDTYDWVSIGMHYEFSGLMIWEDKNVDGLMDATVNDYFGDGELTHYLMPESVDSVSFVTPGAAFGNYLLQDSISLDLEEEVTWGVAFMEVNGTVYPFNSYGYFGWYDGIQTGTDFLTFDERPTKITIDELSFLVHFQGNLDELDPANNNAEIKVDNYIGNWDVDMVGNRDNLENRSLALNYFADVTMSDYSYTWNVEANGTEANNENTVESDVFDFLIEEAPFAEMIMGGVTYDWGKNTTAPYDVVSHITPMGAFRAAYESEGGSSATSWEFASTQYYVTIGFPEWDGYSVFQDPVFVGYVSSRGGSSTTSTVQITDLGITVDVPNSTDPVQVGTNIYVQEGVEILSVVLYYSTDGVNWESVVMNNVNSYYFGDIPAFADGTQVWYYVEVHTTGDSATSEIKTYVVGQGAVTTTTPPPTGGGFDMSILILLGGGAAVVVVIAGLVMRRRK